MDYNYLQAVEDDVRQYINDNIYIDEDTDLDELEEQLREDLWTEDSVTGNASGSYTFNRYRAEEYLAHNLDLLAEALEEFGGDFDPSRGAEYFDVTIRCYLLSQAISNVLQEYE